MSSIKIKLSVEIPRGYFRNDQEQASDSGFDIESMVMDVFDLLKKVSKMEEEQPPVSKASYLDRQLRDFFRLSPAHHADLLEIIYHATKGEETPDFYLDFSLVDLHGGFLYRLWEALGFTTKKPFQIGNDQCITVDGTGKFWITSIENATGFTEENL